MSRRTLETAASDLHEELEPVLVQLEVDRRRALRSYWILVVFLILSTPVVLSLFFGAAWLLHPTSPDGAGFVLFSAFPIWFITTSWIYKKRAHLGQRRYNKRYKEAVLGNLPKRLLPGVRFVPGDGISYYDFARARLFSHEPSVYHSEDKIEGRVGKTDIRLSEVKADRKTLKLDGDGLGTKYIRIFHGLFLIADFHKHFRSSVRVLPERWKHRALPGEQVIRMEDPDFEAEFVVYGTDQVDARYILSTSMLRRILDLCRRWAADVRLAFIDSCVFLTIAQNRDWFEPNIYRSARDPRQIRELAEQMALCLRLVEELNLNTRIWSKS
jgi:hypothetical protein